MGSQFPHGAGWLSAVYPQSAVLTPIPGRLLAAPALLYQCTSEGVIYQVGWLSKSRWSASGAWVAAVLENELSE